MTFAATDVQPAEPFVDVKARIAGGVDAAREEILDLSHRIHAHPEPAFEERYAAQAVADLLQRHGFTVEHPAGSLETAVRATLRGGRGQDGQGERARGQGSTQSGQPARGAVVPAQPEGPRIGILAEYDALPGLGHGCGHNTMAASGVGAALGLAAVASDLPGEIVFLGCPAEERGSGKQFMLDDGLFDGIDAALLFHPSDMNRSETRLLASVDVDATFTGVASHAASDPWEGRNALDALVLLFSSIGLWRQQLRPDARVHGIVLEGGHAANIIPERAVGRFMLRSTDQAYFEQLQDRFREMVSAAALATGCRGEAVFSGGSATMRHNRVLGRRYVANLATFGIDDNPPPTSIGSSDMGNVSWHVPTIHPEVAICDEGVPGHSIQFRDAAITPRADDVTLVVAKVIGQTAAELFLDPGLVAEAWAEFRAADPASA